MNRKLIAIAALATGCSTIPVNSTSDLCGALCDAIESVEVIIESGDTTGLGEAQASLQSVLLSVDGEEEGF